MRQLALLTFLSLDGVMQAPKLPEEDTSGGFARGGWADPYWDEAMAIVGEHAMNQPYDVLFGRATYDMFAAHAGDDHPMRNFRKYVVTSRPAGLDWPHSTPLTGDVFDEVARLKQQDGPLIQVHGSWQLAQSLLAKNLVDELRLCTFPVVLGNGKRLFDSEAAASSYELIRTASTSTGVVLSMYQRLVS